MTDRSERRHRRSKENLEDTTAMRQTYRTPSSMSKGSVNSFNSDPLMRHDASIAFISRLDLKYECPVCCEVLRDPVQFAECGHRCCSTCLTELMK